MDKITFEKENITISCVNGKLAVISRIPISDELVKVIENENNFKSINRALDDLRVNHMIDKNVSVISITLQDNQTPETISKAFEEIKRKHDRLFVLFQRLLECAKEAKKQEQKSANAKKDERQCNGDHEGMYYQQDSTFQKEKDDKSVGFCIISNYKEDIIMSLIGEPIEYEDLDKSDLPLYLELIVAFNKFKEELDLHFLNSYWIRTDYGYGSSGFGCIAVRSRISDSTSGGIGFLGFGCDPAFHSGYRGPRIYRKTWRISKV